MRSLLFFLLIGLCSSAVIVSEIMYNPRQGNDFQYIEFYNNDPTSVDITGWTLTSDKFSFVFPSSSISANSFVILANKKDSFLFAYPSVPASIVFGNMADDLDTGTGKINLKNAAGKAVVDFKYKDSWYPVTDGYGPSLELICFSGADQSDSNSWRASTLYTIADPLLEYSGTPNTVSSWISCPAPKSVTNSNLKISEIMYHPIAEKSKEDRHEWLEIYNPDATDVSLDGFRIVGKKGLRFAFPNGAVISANAYVVVAKNVAAFSTIYSVSSNKLFGGYANELKNGGDALLLIDSNGMMIDQVEYDNKWPYPIAADEQSDMPQYKGMSIERVTFTIEGTKSYNWVASVPTPGAANSAARTAPYPIVTEKIIYQAGVEAKSKLAPSISTNISVKISPKDTFTNVVLEYFVDDINVAGESTFTVLMSPSKDGYTYNFPNGFPGNTILRWRVRADFDSFKSRIVSHRSNDPIQWHGIYFSVPEAMKTSSKVYEIMITKANWTEMWTNMRTETRYRIFLDDPSSGKCCIPNPTWNSENYAVLAYKGQVYDVEVKYQGSNYNRMNGQLITRFNGSNIPTQPSPLRQLSWRIKLADYDSKIDGKDEITITKPKDGGCSFLTSYTMYELARQLGIPAPYISFAQLYVNGGYYVYGMDLEYFSSDMVEKYIEEHNNKLCRFQPTMEVPFLFKANGFGCSEGYDTLSDFQIARDSNGCGFPISATERYERAYNLETEKSYGTVERIQNLTFYMARWNYPYSLDFKEPIKPATRAFMEANFDVNMALNYLVLINFAGAWDDITINYMVNVRQDGKVSMATYDMDALFGGNVQPCSSPQCSLFLGEEGAPVSQYQTPGGYNNLKNALIKTFRTELLERYRVLMRTVLTTENIHAILTNAQNAINVTEWVNDPNWLDEAPMRGGCLAKFKDWTQQRNSYIRSSLGEPANLNSYSVCPDTPAGIRSVSTYRAVPGTPNVPTITKTSDSSATISWPSPNSNGAPITSYNLQRSSNNGGFATIYSGPQTSYIDNDFSATGSLQYRVQAVNSIGASQFSASKSDVTTPSTTGKPNSTPSTTGAVASSSSGSTPSTTGAAQPLTTGVIQPATTGLVQPATTGSNQPATTGAVKPSTTGATTAPSSTTGSAPPSGPCTSGYMKCLSQNTYSTCDRGAWGQSQQCGAGTVCSASGNYIYCVRDNNPSPSTPPPVTPPPSTPPPVTPPPSTPPPSTQPPSTPPPVTPPPSTPAPTTPPPTSDTCTPGYMKCLTTDTYSTCNRGTWGGSQKCSTGNVCSPSGNYIYCVPKTTRDVEEKVELRSNPPHSSAQTNQSFSNIGLYAGLFALVTVASILAIVGYRRVAERKQKEDAQTNNQDERIVSPKFAQLKRRTSSAVIAGKA